MKRLKHARGSRADLSPFIYTASAKTSVKKKVGSLHGPAAQSAWSTGSAF